MKKLMFFAGLLLFTLSIAAQGNKQWGDFEELRTKKATFITDKLELTPEEAQQFWPHYNEFDKLRMELHIEKREIEKDAWENKDNYKDKDFKSIYNKLSEINDKEYNLNKKYRKTFLEVLPAKKALGLEYTEHEFRSQMFREYRNRKRDQE